MIASTIIFLIIWIGCSLIFIGAGIASGKSKKPVGINTCEKVPKPEEFTDVTAYNLAHRNLWFTFAGIFDASGIFYIFSFSFWNNKNLVPAMTVLIFLFIFADIVMVELVHKRLLEKYRKI